MTIKEIAKLAGVSTATVSYALNGTGKVSPEVRERILKIATEHNYRPNLIAKSLRSNRSYTIGVLAEDINVFSSPKIFKGIQEYADEHNYQLILNDLGLYDKIQNRFDESKKYKSRIKDALALLKGLQVDGIIYIGMHDRNVSDLVETNQPIVYTYSYTDRPEDYTVTYSNEIAYDMTSYLIGNGHRRIGLISGMIDSTPSHKRLIGYQTALMDHGISLNMDYIKVGNWEYQFAYDACVEFLAMKEPPTAIFALNDIMAVGAIDAALDKKLEVPKELSVVGFDNTEIGSYFRPKLTTVELPLREIGYTAAEIVDKISKGEEVTERNRILPCKLVIRETVSALC